MASQYTVDSDAISAHGTDTATLVTDLDAGVEEGDGVRASDVFAEFERAMIRERILAGLRRTTKKSGRKPMPDDRVDAIRRSLIDGLGIPEIDVDMDDRKIGRAHV